MTFNSLMQLIDNGLEPEQILAFLQKNSPHFAKKIGKYLTSGYGLWETVGGLANDPEASRLNPSKFKPYSTEDIARITAIKNRMSIPEQREQQVKQRMLGMLRGGINLAAGIGGGIAVGRALKNAPNIAKQIGGMLGGGAVSPAPEQTAQAPVEEAMGAMSQASSIPLQDLRVDLDRLRLTPKIEKLAATNAPETLGALLQKQIAPEEIQGLEQKFKQPFSEIVKNYAESYLKKSEEKPFSREGLQSQFDAREVSDDQKINPKVPETSSQESERLALLPDGGVGKVLEERQGIGTVEMPDGKMRRKRMSEVEVEPPELAQQINDLIEALPEEEKSRVLAFASYNPGNEFTFEGKKMNIPFMGVQFHNGDFYMYPGVSKEQFDKVVEKATRAKTSGENEWGVWTKGDPSRGAGMYELIKELEANFGKNFIKFKASEGYDFWKRFRNELKDYFRRKKRSSI